MKHPNMKNLKINWEGTKEIREMMAKTPNPKIKITINLDAETLSEIRKLAEKAGMPYQPMLNVLLKEGLNGRRVEESTLDSLEKEVARLKKKLSA